MHGENKKRTDHTSSAGCILRGTKKGFSTLLEESEYSHSGGRKQGGRRGTKKEAFLNFGI